MIIMSTARGKNQNKKQKQNNKKNDFYADYQFFVNKWPSKWEIILISWKDETKF